MLDEKTLLLLQLLSNKCSLTSYTVLTIDELSEQLPEGLGFEKEVIYKMLSELSQKGYITVRYDRDGEFCLFVTEKARAYIKARKTPIALNKKIHLIDLLPYFLIFLAIFSGIILSAVFLKIVGIIC